MLGSVTLEGAKATHSSGSQAPIDRITIRSDLVSSWQLPAGINARHLVARYDGAVRRRAAKRPAPLNPTDRGAPGGFLGIAELLRREALRPRLENPISNE